MRKLIYIILFCITVAGVATPVSALTVSPARFEITGDPGTTLQGEIELFNEQEGVRTFFTSFENFEPSGDSGAPHFIGGRGGLATWMRASSKVILKSGERTIVPFSIAIPKDAEPGGHFAAVFFGSQAPGAQGGGEVSIGGKIGVLVLLRVSGEVSEGGGLLNFGEKENNKFFNSLPITFEYRLNNTGGDRVVPVGEVKIKNTFRITSAKLVANENEGSVLPNSARKFEVVWGDKSTSSKEETEKNGFFAMALEQLKEFHFGWYTAHVSLSWGQSNQTGEASYNFFIIPWQLLLIIIIVLLLIIVLGRATLRRYNRFIISKAIEQK